MSTAPPDGNEWATITLLLIGGLFMGIGWVVGAVVMWRSKVWTVPEKLAGTFLWPGGLATGAVVAIAFRDEGALGVLVIVLALTVPLATAWLLWRRTQHWSS